MPDTPAAAEASAAGVAAGTATGSVDPRVPARAAGIELIGELPGSGYRDPPALVRRADGQMMQLTPLLYTVLQAIDGRRAYAEVAEVVSAVDGRTVSADNVVTLVDKLRALGVVLRADGSEPELKRSDPLLGLQFRYTVTDPVRTRRLTAPFTRLFNPVLVTAVVAAFGYLTWWLLLDKGLASATHEAFHRPGLLLAVFVVTVLSAGFHELGHAAAAQRGGSTPGVMGVGLYLFWPAFYTDVTDSYRLDRRGRLRTDLGGLYFNALVAVGIVGLWLVTRYDALLLVVATQVLQMLRQLLPLIRFDGYHVLADLTGVPDLYQRIGPVLLGFLPSRRRDPQVTALKPWARAVVTLWVLTVVPLLAVALLLLVVALPRVLATAWVGVRQQWAVLAGHWADGELISVLARLLAVIALVLPVLGVAYILVRLLRRVVGSVWRRTSGRPVRRGVALVTAAALVVGLGWAWWPDGDTYRPVAAYERGTLGGAVPFARAAPALGQPLAAGDELTVQTTWPQGAPRPTEAEPRLALVMVPRTGDREAGRDDADVDVDEDAGGDAGETAEDGDASPDLPSEEVPPDTVSEEAVPRTGVFPFDLPPPPADGDNQALAVNTTDDTVAYDVAFAMVWVDDDTVTTANEAFAAASCSRCAAVAVSFQVVLVLSDADVIVPANLATAVNYDCLECLTYALANQLVVTLDGPLSEEGMAALTTLWARIAAFGSTITSVPLAELQATLDGFSTEIRTIIESDRAAAPGDPGPDAGDPSPTPTPTDASGSPAPSDPVAPSSSASQPAEPSATPSPGDTPSGSPSPSTTPSSSPTSTPTPTPSTEPTPTPTADPTGTTSGPAVTEETP